MKRVIPWLAAALIITIVFGTIYGVGQQLGRLDANYPQVQLAEDIAAHLDAGSKPETFTSGKVDIGSGTLSPFITIYSLSGSVLAGTGYLHDKLAQVPKGVLTAATEHHDNRVTWQPESGVRMATVTVRADNYYVTSGRSLREVEQNATTLLKITALGWLISLFILSVTALIGTGVRTTRSRTT